MAIRLGLTSNELNDPLLYAYPTSSSMLYICYRSRVRSSFAKALLVMAHHQNPYFSSKLPNFIYSRKDGIACQSRSNGI